MSDSLGAGNTGSFGGPLGGIDALKASMKSRGMDTSVLDQVSAAAPGVQSSPGVVSQPMPQPDASMAVTQATGQPQEPKQSFRSAESEIATKALASIVSTDNAIARQAIQFS